MAEQVHRIRCPSCGAEQDARLIDEIDVSRRPELRDALMANGVNRVACPSCGFSFRVDVDLLYRDPARGFAIRWTPAGKDGAAGAERSFVERRDAAAAAVGAEGPVAAHLVLTRVELVERIFLLEAGLDERVIEYVKHLIYSNNAKALDPASRILLFNAQDSTPENLCFVVQDASDGRFLSVLHYRRAAYEALREMFDDDGQTPNLMELFPGPYVSARRLLAG